PRLRHPAITIVRRICSAIDQEEMGIKAGQLRGVVLAAALGLVACTAVEMTRTMDDFAHNATRWDIEFHWNCVRSEPGLLQVEGVAISTYLQSPIKDLKFRMYGVDAGGATVSHTDGAARDYLIPLMARSPFRLTLRTEGREVRFDLVYSFAGQESGGMANSSTSGERNSVLRDVCRVEKRYGHGREVTCDVSRVTEKRANP
ncbi:MAG TPA: hypothetical protein VN648_10970, partial [Candidatus Methylomirabilis sp.]|nr:hypothetical protein [Candidatus Methylomirabilis sp.]